MLKTIIGLTCEEIKALTVADIGDRIITRDELFYMADKLGAHWQYDYDAAASGKPGLHALLKSERHSDRFFVSKILLARPNIREIVADQLVKVFRRAGLSTKRLAVTGIPEGAKELGRDFARILGVPFVEMEKEDGKIRLTGKIPLGFRLLFIEDFCTRGTGLAEAVTDVLTQEPETEIYLVEVVILNRGGLEVIKVRVGDEELVFAIAALVTERIDDWDPESGECRPCRYGSVAIRPKASDENWELINAAQK